MPGILWTEPIEKCWQSSKNSLFWGVTCDEKPKKRDNKLSEYFP